MVFPFPRPFPGPSAMVSYSVLSLFMSGEQGAWYDPSDFIPNWRRNLLTQSEFANGVTDAPTRAGLLTETAFAGLNSNTGLAFGHDGTTGTYAYKTNVAVAGTPQTFSAYVRMTDGNAPVFGSATINSSANDFVIAIGGSPVTPTIYSVENIGGGLYRVSAHLNVGAIAANNTGLLKYNTNSSRTFTTSGYQLVLGSTATAYQKITDGVADYFTYQPQPVMFQDIGSTPVTAVEQPVGLILDKSKGLALGPELVTNANNETALYSGAGAVNGTLVRAAAPGGGLAAMFTCNAGTVSYQALYQTIAANTAVKVTVRVYVPTGSINAVQLFDANDGSWTAATSTVKDSWVTLTAIRPAKATAWILGMGQVANQTLGGQVFYVDDLSVRALPGNHASQSTAASRPVLSARVNLLTYSEQFDNAAWIKSGLLAFGSGSIVNATTAPDGTTTADLLTENSSNSAHYLYRNFTNVSASQTYSICAKANGRNWITLNPYTGATDRRTSFDLANGIVGTNPSGNTASITSLGNGWYRCTVSRVTAADAGSFEVCLASADNTISYAGNGVSGVYLWGADLRVTNDGVGIPAYQRVAAATDYDTSGFPLYLRFDGVDDSLATASINFSATDKMSVFAGIRRLSDAAAGLVAELSVFANANGAFFLYGTSTTGVYDARVAGSISVGIASSASYSSPRSNVLTLIGDISANITRLRVNGVVDGSSSSDLGTGNFGNHVLYIGRRGSSTIPLNARLYSLIVRGAQSTDAQIASTEAWVNGKTMAY